MPSSDDDESRPVRSGVPEHDAETSTEGSTQQHSEDSDGSDPEVEPDGGQPEAVIIYLHGARALILAEGVTDSTPSRWGRLVTTVTGRELSSLMRTLDPVTQALVKAKQLTGQLVELHPTDIEMLKNGAQTVTEEGGWLHGTLRDNGRYARVMRVRPGTTAVTNGAMMLAAVAAQAQAEAIARDIRTIRQGVQDVRQYQRDEQIGAAANAVDQVEAVIEVLRQHGSDGVDPSEFSVIRDSLGDARAKCLQHLKTAIEKLEGACGPGISLSDLESEFLTQGATDEVLAYLTQLDELRRATVEFGLAQAAFDIQEGRHGVAQTRLTRLSATVDALNAEIDEAWARVAELVQTLTGRRRVRSVLARASREIGTKALLGLGGGAMLGAAPAAASAVSGTDEGISRDRAAKTVAITGAVLGGVGGLAAGGKNTVQDVRARKPLEHRIEQLDRTRQQVQAPENPSVPSLHWFSEMTDELAPPGQAS